MHTRIKGVSVCEQGAFDLFLCVCLYYSVFTHLSACSHQAIQILYSFWYHSLHTLVCIPVCIMYLSYFVLFILFTYKHGLELKRPSIKKVRLVVVVCCML